jgi:hypothetical protein
VSDYRYDTDVAGQNAAVGEIGGEFRLRSGSAFSGYAEITTKQRGNYQAGCTGQVGIGARVPTLPVGTQILEWGYTDRTNGFFFGVDASGLFISKLAAGVETKVYQSSWNADKLDGTGDSGITIDLTDGHIFQIDFTWYGYGMVEYSIIIHNTLDNVMEKHIVHSTHIDEGVSVQDPNLPLYFRSANRAGTAANIDLYIGGHQFSTYTGQQWTQQRLGSELLTNFTTATNTNWQPLIAIRKKTALNGRKNSVNVKIEDFFVAADNEMEVRLTVLGTTSNLTWGTPTDRTASETAIETKVTGGTALTLSTDGEPYEYSYINSSGGGQSGSRSDNTNQTISEFLLGENTEVILWIRRLTASGAMIVKHAHITWVEDF